MIFCCCAGSLLVCDYLEDGFPSQVDGVNYLDGASIRSYYALSKPVSYKAFYSRPNIRETVSQRHYVLPFSIDFSILTQRIDWNTPSLVHPITNFQLCFPDGIPPVFDDVSIYYLDYSVLSHWGSLNYSNPDKMDSLKQSGLIYQK